MNQPKVSVLLPAGPSLRYLGEAIASLVTQTGVDFEIILIDNNPEKRFFEKFFSTTAGHPTIKIIHEPVVGIAQALNTGLNHSRGSYIARMDADDICLPGRLSKQADFLDQHPKTGLVSGLVELFGNDGTNQGMNAYVDRINSWITEQDLYDHRFVESPIAHPSVMFRRQLIDTHGSYSTAAVPEDYELWLRWFGKGVRMAKLPMPVIRWRDHTPRLSRSNQNYSREAFDTIRLHYLTAWLHENKPLPPVWIWGGGKYSRKKATELEERGILVSGFIDVSAKRVIEGYPVLHYTQTPPPGQIFVISMVSNRGKYQEIDSWLRSRNYKRDLDYLIAS